jgi:hypothetical protein
MTFVIILAVPEIISRIHGKAGTLFIAGTIVSITS